jgi:NACalpha-BTF3-like transcription factor
MAEMTVKKPTKVLVIGTRHELQRHQDTIPGREKLRVEFDKWLRQIIKQEKIDLIAEEAGDDKEELERLKQDEKATPPELEELFEGTEAVDHPVSTIAKKIANDEVRHEDVDVDVRVVSEDDIKSIKERSDAMIEKILKALAGSERPVVIVGELHHIDVIQRLVHEGMDVESLHFP